MDRTKLNLLAALAAPAGLSAPASGQFWTMGTTITWSADWAEAAGGNGNGVLDPGESALVRLSVSFTNQNTRVMVLPSPNFQWGTVRGFGGAALDLHGSGGAEGAWNVTPAAGFGIDRSWDLLGREGAAANGGADVLDIEPGQFPASLSQVNTTNPVLEIWTGLWTPADYAARAVRFQISGVAGSGRFVSSVIVEDPSGPIAGVYAPGQLGSVEIPVGVPGPGTVLALGALFAPRRRRR